MKQKDRPRRLRRNDLKGPTIQEVCGLSQGPPIGTVGRTTEFALREELSCPLTAMTSRIKSSIRDMAVRWICCPILRGD